MDVDLELYLLMGCLELRENDETLQMKN